VHRGARPAASARATPTRFPMFGPPRSSILRSPSWPTTCSAPSAAATRTARRIRAPRHRDGQHGRKPGRHPHRVVGPEHIVRDIDIMVESAAMLEQTTEAVRAVEGIDLPRSNRRRPRAAHRRQDRGAADASGTHTARPATRVHAGRRRSRAHQSRNDPDDSYLYTIRGKTVAVVTNGTRVLGLGNIGPLAALR